MPSSSTTAPHRLSPPPVLRREVDPQTELRERGFQVDLLLGRGGMGEVYRALDPAGRPVALKVLSPRWAESAEMVQRFQREASMLARLRHPHIVTLYEYGLAAGAPFFTMELLESPNLRQVMKQRPLSVRDCLALVISVTQAIDYAHRAGVIHRDLKPSNIVVGPALSPKVVDFGVAMQLGEEGLTQTGEAIGTADYMAPEQGRDSHEVDGRADLYSLGLILYELLCGDRPKGMFKLPSERIRDVPAGVDAALKRALASEPGDRQRVCAELADELIAALGQAPAADQPRPPPCTLEAEPGRVQVSFSGALDGARAAEAAQALSSELEHGGARDLVYELSGASDLTLGAIKPLAQVHQLHRAHIRRIGLCASVPLVRGSALVLAAAVPQINARVFATHAGLDRWLAEAA